MKLVLYDFDKTIYDGDSSFDFFLFCLRKKPLISLYVPIMFFSIVLYKFRIINKTKMKEMLFLFLKKFNNIDNIIRQFWSVNIKKIKGFYNVKGHKDDIIISASPEFLLKPVARMFVVKDLICTKMNKYNGKIKGNNCYGEEKLNRFLKKYDVDDIYEVYSDSYSDLPLLLNAKKAYFVKGNDIRMYKQK